MASNVLPCPNNGKCGSNNHRADSKAYKECLSLAKNNTVKRVSSSNTKPAVVPTTAPHTNQSLRCVSGRYSDKEKEYIRNFFDSSWDAEYNIKNTSGMAIFKEATVFIEKPSIKTEFAFSDEGKDLRREAWERSEKDFFVQENLNICDTGWQINALSSKNGVKPWLMYKDGEKPSEGYIIYETDKEYALKKATEGYDVRPLTDSEINDYKEMLWSLQADFVKRLKSYVKRYGTEKVDVYYYDSNR